MKGLLLVGAMLAVALCWATPAWAEYRAYELEVTDVFDCRLNKLEKCKTFRVRTAMAPDLYARTHGGDGRIGVIMLATWFCRGDTSGFRQVCPLPNPRKPKFAVGDDVQVSLQRHITQGWRGKVEVAYYQRSVNANIYGVRFAERQQVYARYFEKDLAKSAPPAPAASGAATTPVTPAAPGAAATPVAPGAPGAAATPAAPTPPAAATP